MEHNKRKVINGRAVRAWMVLQGLTQTDVGRAAGCAQQVVSRYLQGKHASGRLTQWYLKAGCPARHLPELRERRAPRAPRTTRAAA